MGNRTAARSARHPTAPVRPCSATPFPYNFPTVAVPRARNGLTYWNHWRSQGDSNPCFRRERATSWAARRWEPRTRAELYRRDAANASALTAPLPHARPPGQAGGSAPVNLSARKLLYYVFESAPRRTAVKRNEVKRDGERRPPANGFDRSASGALHSRTRRLRAARDGRPPRHPPPERRRTLAEVACRA